MRLVQSSWEIALKKPPTKTSRGWVIALSLAVVFASATVPAQAQLGITGFHLFNGFHDTGLLGSASAVGDFNADGYDDLAVGEPGRDFGSVSNAGGVRVFAGGPGGWSFSNTITAAYRAIRSKAGAGFGSALASGDFDHDGHDDLAIGAPGNTVSSASSAGEIFVFYGRSVPSGRATTRGIVPQLFDVSRTQVLSQIGCPVLLRLTIDLAPAWRQAISQPMVSTISPSGSLTKAFRVPWA